MSRSVHCSCCVEYKSKANFIPEFCSLTPETGFQIADEIALLDAEVLRFDDTIIGILNQRAVLNRRRNAFMPAVNLPLEILTMIFEFLCFSNDDVRIDDIVRHFERDWSGEPRVVTPLFIGSICSAWRNIALGLPQLWNRINIIYGDLYAEEEATIFRHWLNKSGQRPLIVRIVDDLSNKKVTSTSVIDILAAYAHRLHTLDLFLPSLWEPAMIHTANHLPLLTHLTLRTHTPSHRKIERVDIFAETPQLREVTLIRYMVADVSLPWAQLESLTACYNNLSECFQTLRRCPCLRHCAVSLDEDEDDNTMHAPITHAVLEVFELLIESPTDLAGLLRILTFPVLRSFLLWIRFGEHSEFMPLMVPFLLRFAETMESLHLQGLNYSEEELVACLRVLPELRKLVLHRYRPEWRQLGQFTNKILDLMNPTKHAMLRSIEIEAQGDVDNAFRAGTRGDKSNTDLCLVPNLETFEYQGPVEFSLHTLVEFLVARWRGPSTACASGLGLEYPNVDTPGTRTTSDPLPSRRNAPPVVRLRTARIWTPNTIQFEDADDAVVQELRLDGMHLVFLKSTDY